MGIVRRESIFEICNWEGSGFEEVWDESGREFILGILKIVSVLQSRRQLELPDLQAPPKIDFVSIASLTVLMVEIDVWHTMDIHNQRRGRIRAFREK